jgi:hypothetical protein
MLLMHIFGESWKFVSYPKTALMYDANTYRYLEGCNSHGVYPPGG